MRPALALADEFATAAAKLRALDRGPYLIFDLPAVADAARALARVAQAEGVLFAAAVKALPFEALLSAAALCGGGFDASNETELDRLAAWNEAGQSGAIPYLAVTGPAIGRRAVRPRRLADRLTVNIEDEAQLPLLERLSPWARTVELGLRIGAPPAANGPADGRGISRFGFPDSAGGVVSQLVKDPRFAGFHSHMGGDALPRGAHLAMLKVLLATAAAFGVRPRLFNLGGGLRRETVAQIGELCRAARALLPYDATVIFEPGAWLTAQGGHALTKVLSVTRRDDLDASVVTVDLSRDCHGRWSDLVLERWWGPPPPAGKILVFGPTCHEGDFLGAFEWRGQAPEPPTGSAAWVSFRGLTGYAAAFNTGFNGVGPATVVTLGKSGGV